MISDSLQTADHAARASSLALLSIASTDQLIFTDHRSSKEDAWQCLTDWCRIFFFFGVFSTQGQVLKNLPWVGKWYVGGNEKRRTRVCCFCLVLTAEPICSSEKNTTRARGANSEVTKGLLVSLRPNNNPVKEKKNDNNK